jgi:hypothetical protein
LMARSKTMTAPRDTMIALPDPGFAELDFRAGDGLEVSLLWERARNAVFVAVLVRCCARPQAGQYFEVPVEPDQSALDGFRHPFAYQRSSSTAKLPRDALRVTVAAERGGT